METNLWTHCHGPQHRINLHETAWRIVEAQHILSTRKLVDSAHEQEILEDLIDAVKPKLSQKLLAGLHPLLFTPFRYPPLPYGSRFGTRAEPSLWYGSLKLSGAMAEKAFYQFVFLKASKTDFGLIEVSLTAFTTPIKTNDGINLSLPPFNKHTAIISSSTHYRESQALGSAMRSACIDACLYTSARDPEHSLNIALFTPKAFLHPNPDSDSFQTWQCVANSHSIEFRRTSALENESKCLTVEMFQVGGVLPGAVG